MAYKLSDAQNAILQIMYQHGCVVEQHLASGTILYVRPNLETRPPLEERDLRVLVEQHHVSVDRSTREQVTYRVTSKGYEIGMELEEQTTEPRLSERVPPGTWYEIGTWYECIEEPVREIVKMLRNNGFNTYSSCGHTREVRMEWYKDHEITRLWNLLFEHGYKYFAIAAHWDASSPARRTLTLTLGSNPSPMREME